MTFSVLNVGDGACSVVRCGYRWCDNLAVVDCGEWRAPAKRPTELLVNYVGKDLSGLRTIVVTHFHEDHWRGLFHLPSMWPAGVRYPEQLDVVYPSIPSVGTFSIYGSLEPESGDVLVNSIRSLPESASLALGMSAFISATSTSRGVRAADLIAEWGKVTTVVPRPLVQGDEFRMGCDSWEVLWPPRVLPRSLEKAIGKVLLELEQLADDLKDLGSPGLREQLDNAYSESSAFAPAADIEDERYEVEPDQRHTSARRSNTRSKARDAFPASGPADPEQGGDPHTNEISPAFPESHLPTAKTLARRLSSVANLLSLVFHNPEPLFVPHSLVTGDIEGSALDQLVNERRYNDIYDLILAPHHGTHDVPAGFPAARVCVSQNGPRHEKWWHRHTDSHQHSDCLGTNSAGSIVVV